MTPYYIANLYRAKGFTGSDDLHVIRQAVDKIVRKMRKRGARLKRFRMNLHYALHGSESIADFRKCIIFDCAMWNNAVIQIATAHDRGEVIDHLIDCGLNPRDVDRLMEAI